MRTRVEAVESRALMHAKSLSPNPIFLRAEFHAHNFLSILKKLLDRKRENHTWSKSITINEPAMQAKDKLLIDIF
jgi:hypothetical protein